MHKSVTYNIEKITDPDLYELGPRLEITFSAASNVVTKLRKKLDLNSRAKASTVDNYWFATLEQKYRAIEPFNYPCSPGLTVLDFLSEDTVLLSIEISWIREIDEKKVIPVIDALGLDRTKTLKLFQEAMNSIYDEFHKL